jgi:archaellum component FlaC
MIFANKGRTAFFGQWSDSIKQVAYSLFFALLALPSAQAQEQTDLSKIDSQINNLSKQIGLHKSILNGLSEDVNGLRRIQKEMVSDEAQQQEGIDKLATALTDLRGQLESTSQSISGIDQQLGELIQEQDELRKSVESSASKVQTAIVISVVVGILSVLIAFLVARAAIRNNKLNWYSLVRDTLILRPKPQHFQP